MEGSYGNSECAVRRQGNGKGKYIHTYVRTYIHTYIRTYIHTYVRMYVHKYVRTYIHTYIHTCVRTYVRTDARRVSVHRLTFVREADIAYVEEVRLITFVQCTGWLESYLTVGMLQQKGIVLLTSWASIATRYGLDGPGIEFRWERDLPHPSGRGAHPAAYTVGTGSFRGLKGQGVAVTTHPI
jgi:hypothetical protein